MSDKNGGINEPNSDQYADNDFPPISGSQSRKEPKLEAAEPNKNEHTAQQNTESMANKSLRWIHRKAGDVGLHDWLMVIFTFFLTVVAIEQGILAWQNSETSTVQIGKIIDAANRIEDAADSFSGSAARINEGIAHAVNNLNTEAGATKRLAGQALQQTRTARQSLHISERAYVDVISPSLDGQKAVFYLPITNTGRIPSGQAVITVHEAVYEVSVPGTPPGIFNYVDRSWKNTRLASVPPGSPIKLIVPMRKLSWQQLISGHQLAVVVGSISYDDGFTNQTTEFCWNSVIVVSINEIDVRPCDPKAQLPNLIQIDGYPNNEESD